MSSKITALSSKSKHNAALKVPKHLTASSRHFYEQICNDYVLESHHLRLLQLLCEAFDRGQEARKLLATEGLTVVDTSSALSGRTRVFPSNVIAALRLQDSREN